jgi:hypothetical protein
LVALTGGTADLNAALATLVYRKDQGHSEMFYC